MQRRPGSLVSRDQQRAGETLELQRSRELRVESVPDAGGGEGDERKEPRRRGDRLVLAMSDPAPRWTFETRVDESLFPDRLERLAHRYPPAASATIERAWAGLYDMTPDAHPIVGKVAEGVYAACGFSGHGFMQSPAVGRALAELIVRGESSLDLGPYALERFEAGAVFPEEVVL